MSLFLSEGDDIARLEYWNEPELDIGAHSPFGSRLACYDRQRRRRRAMSERAVQPTRTTKPQANYAAVLAAHNRRNEGLRNSLKMTRLIRH